MIESTPNFIIFLRQRHWITLLGYLLFTGMMAVGYYYNVTFVQLGLVDLGVRRIGMTQQAVANHMAYLALITCVLAVVVGGFMRWRGWSARFVIKLRLAWLVVCLQTLLTALAPTITSESAFLAWIIAASVALGIGVPATFAMTVDLIPTADRGYVAAAITALAYFAAAVFSTSWRIEAFTTQFLLIMIPGSISLGVFLFGFRGVINRLAEQHRDPAFGQGRFVRLHQSNRLGVNPRLIGLIVLMFGIYFIDSLGFLRLLETPVYMNTAWQSPDVDVRLVIAGMHIVGALVAGILYNGLQIRSLFLWIFGIFALVHLLYGIHAMTDYTGSAPLAMPILYAVAVSLYTVVNFAIWADISTPRTISLNAAIGVALSGWTATFISTALAIQWQSEGITFADHIHIVNAAALLFFMAVLALIYLRRDTAPTITERAST